MILELLLLINSDRINPLILDSNLSVRAEKRAEIVYKSEWSNKDWKKSFENTGCTFIGENLAKDFKDAKETHNALMASPTHKANIVKDKYNKIGIGTYKNVIVELFCKYGKNKL